MDGLGESDGCGMAAISVLSPCPAGKPRVISLSSAPPRAPATTNPGAAAASRPSRRIIVNALPSPTSSRQTTPRFMLKQGGSPCQPNSTTALTGRKRTDCSEHRRGRHPWRTAGIPCPPSASFTPGHADWRWRSSGRPAVIVVKSAGIASPRPPPAPAFCCAGAPVAAAGDPEIMPDRLTPDHRECQQALTLPGPGLTRRDRVLCRHVATVAPRSSWRTVHCPG